MLIFIKLSDACLVSYCGMNFKISTNGFRLLYITQVGGFGWVRVGNIVGWVALGISFSGLRWVTRLEAFETKGLRKILRVSWTAKKTNECVLNKAGVKRELLDTVKARKLAYYGHTMRKQGRKEK